MKSLIIAVLLLLVGAWWYAQQREVNPGPGQVAPADPVQEMLDQAPAFTLKDYAITPLANYQVTARVLSRENYYLGRESDLSPVDFALGWGAMSDSHVLEKISISQSGRWYHWHSFDMPIAQHEIEIHSANTHLIPANSYINNLLAQVHRGNVVTLRGKLVHIDALHDDWHWQSSLTREDTGDGACEVMYVESVSIK